MFSAALLWHAQEGMNSKNLADISGFEPGGVRGLHKAYSLSTTREIVSAHAKLFKVRILGGVAASALLGAFVAGVVVPNGTLLVLLLIGTALSYAGAAAWNQVLEVPYDSQMPRTRERPLPSGRLSRHYAAIIGTLCAIIGMVLLYLCVNPVTGLLSVAAFISYVFVYTPLKRAGWYGTLIGTIPGAIPAMGGAAASGQFEVHTAIALFFLMVFWQLPHFYSYLWEVRTEYQAAGFKMLPYARNGGASLMNRLVLTGALITFICTVYIAYFSLKVSIAAGLAACGAAGYMVYRSYCFVNDPDRGTSIKLFKSTIFFIVLFTCAAGISNI